MEFLEARQLLATFSEAGGLLNLVLDQANTNLEIRPIAGSLSTSFDVTAPGDQISLVGYYAPSSEGVERAINNSTTDKYLNFGGAGSGLVVTPKMGATIVRGCV